jgi:TonB dependent receptor-like, beta-barrel/CarboxypepD_reg-like domain/TonB-dependent Receptor Plug Domain
MLLQRPGLVLWGALLALTLSVNPGDVQAQSIRLDLTNSSLAVGLGQVVAQGEVDVVYAQRLVQGVVVSCSYRGATPLNALRCLLRGTNLEARSTGPRQYVIVARSRTARERTVAGVVLNGSSGQPLPGAHVLLVDLGRGAITNRTGFFSFPAMREGPQRVQISFLGFTVLDTLVNASKGSSRFRLTPQAIMADEVLVQSTQLRPGDRTPLPGMSAPPMTRLERLPAALGGRDLLEALSWLPGIRRSGEVTGGLLVRGSGPDQNLYLLDGAPVYHPWHAFSLISTFQTETFRSVRVYRGAFPAEFGGRLSAVLDAELSDGRGPEPEARAAINAHSGRFLIETPIGSRSSFMLGGRRSYIDRLIGDSHPVSDEFGRRDTLRTGYYFYDWTAKLVFRPDDKSRLSFTSYRGRDDLDLRLPFDLSLDLSSWLRPTDLLFEVKEFWRNRVFSARYERLLSARWYLTATAYDSRYEAQEGIFLRPTLSSSVRSSYGVDIRDLGARIDVDFFRSDRHQLRMGAQVVSREFSSSIDALVEYNPDLSERLQETSRSTAVEISGYLQDTWQATNQIEVIAGLRTVAFGSDRIARVEPRLSAQWSVDPQLLLIRASLTRSYQYLHRIKERQSFLYDIVSSRWIPSSRTTSPARGTELALGVESRPRGMELSAGVYLRNQKHILLPRDVYQSKSELVGPGIEIGALLGQYVAGEARAMGLELGASGNRNGFFGSVAVTFERSETRAREIGEQRFRPARFDVPVSVQAYAERRVGAWGYGIGAHVRSGYPLTIPEARYELSGPLGDEPVAYLYRTSPNNGRLPAYWRVDANVTRTFGWLDMDWRVQLQLYNVLSHRNVIDRLFEPTGTSVRTVDRRGLPLLPLFEIEIVL